MDEDEFFHKGESGGTQCYSAYDLASSLIDSEYPTVRWNVYPFHFSDGEDWDVEHTVGSLEQLGAYRHGNPLPGGPLPGAQSLSECGLKPAADLSRYVYYEREQDNRYDATVEVVDRQAVMNWGIPRILVIDGNYKRSSQLYLKHAYEGLPLDQEYCEKTLAQIHHLWKRPVFLETCEENEHGIEPRIWVADDLGARLTVDD